MNICDTSPLFSLRRQCLVSIVSTTTPDIKPCFSNSLVYVVKWCLDNSISSQVTTPVSSQDLASALIAALVSNTVSPVSAPNDIVFDILLAEDNLVNQKLAVKILEKYGHSVEIAENGSLAVDAFKARVLRNQPFNIILVSVLLVYVRILALTSGVFFRWMYQCLSWAAWKRRNSSELMRSNSD